MNVYAIQSESGPIKIGVSSDPKSRLKLLTQAQPFDASIIHVEPINGASAFAVEAAAHALLRSKRRRGEWFDITKEQAVAAIQMAMAAVDRGESQKRMLLRIEHPPADRVPDDTVSRLLWLVENRKVLTWRLLEWALGGKPFSTGTLRRHYEAEAPPPDPKPKKTRKGRK